MAYGAYGGARSTLKARRRHGRVVVVSLYSATRVAITLALTDAARSLGRYSGRGLLSNSTNPVFWPHLWTRGAWYARSQSRRSLRRHTSSERAEIRARGAENGC